MKKILIIGLFLANFSSFAQEKFTFNGTMEIISISQGGMQVPDEFYLPRPLLNYTLLLVRFEGNDSVPKPFKTFKSDSLGNFSIKVAPGTYGIVAVNDTIVANQYVPTPFYSQDESWNGRSSAWVINQGLIPGPIVIKDEEATSIVITHHQYSWCGMCP